MLNLQATNSLVDGRLRRELSLMDGQGNMIHGRGCDTLIDPNDINAYAGIDSNDINAIHWAEKSDALTIVYMLEGLLKYIEETYEVAGAGKSERIILELDLGLSPRELG